MISLRDTSHIPAPPEWVWAFFAGMESHCHEWHPSTSSGRAIEGNATIPKSVVFAEEELGRRRLKAMFFIDRAERNRFFSYRLGFPYSLLRAGGYFEIKPMPQEKCELVAEVHMGYSALLTGALVDRALSPLVPIDHLRRHMSEEGEKMARLVTSGNGAEPPGPSSGIDEVD